MCTDDGAAPPSPTFKTRKPALIMQHLSCSKIINPSPVRFYLGKKGVTFSFKAANVQRSETGKASGVLTLSGLASLPLGFFFSVLYGRCGDSDIMI